jgi:hypothetical protein
VSSWARFGGGAVFVSVDLANLQSLTNTYSVRARSLALLLADR